jgi:hypothetical protein
MANTALTTKEAGGLHFYFFTTASAATTETCAGPIGKQVVSATQANIGGTATALTFKYTAASGNCDFSALTATNTYVFCVITD